MNENLGLLIIPPGDKDWAAFTKLVTDAWSDMQEFGRVGYYDSLRAVTPSFKVKLKVPLRVWVSPDYNATKSTAPDPAGTIRDVLQTSADGKWYRVAGGWMPSDPAYSERA